jgi:RNA polymerase sigma-70 factor (ECF subfamily)
MAKLPERHRTILIMRYHYGFKVKEIARQLSMTEGTARSAVARAKAKLEEICRREGLL